MQIQRQNKHGAWDNLAEGSDLSRINSDWGKYIFEFTNERHVAKTKYRITLDAAEIEKITKSV